MLSFPAAIKVYLCTVPCDMRRSFDGLSMMAEHVIRCNPFSGHLLVFCNRRTDRLKILYWDRDGWAIWYKRLEAGTFQFPFSETGRKEIAAWELGLLLVWAARWREDVIALNGAVKRVLRFAVLGTSSEIKGKKEARDILQAKLRPINQGRQRPQSTMTLEQFVSELWKPGVIPKLRSGSSRYYDVQLRCHILPAFGSRRLCDITRVDVQCFLADKRKHGFSGSSAHGMRTTISKVLQAAVDWNLLEQNPARGIRIGDRTPKKERLYLNPREVGQLLTSLPEPCRTLVLVAVLTGLRIGEILALRWKAVDLTRGVIQVRETVSEGKFGFPKTKSSRRDIPISLPVRDALQAQITDCRQRGLEDLVFATRKQTPLNPKNLLRRVLRPTCKVLGLPLISWHSFRHTHATQLAEVGESLRTAQSLLGHSDLETTLNVYTHAIPDAQRRAVDKIAEILFTNVHNISVVTEN